MKELTVRSAGVLTIPLLLAACATPTPQVVRETVLVTQPPLPTYTAPPTYTPYPTHTLQSPLPTYTPAPTYTPYPTCAAPPTPTPSATPSPTLLPTPSATSSPMPSPTPSPTSAPTKEASSGLAALEQEMVDAVNRERQAQGLPALQVDPVLTEIARAHAQDMMERNYFSHTTPEGKTYRDRLKERGIELEWVGENFRAESCPQEQVVECTMAWLMEDLSHRQNILNEQYRRIGVGAAKGATGLYMFVQDFSE